MFTRAVSLVRTDYGREPGWTIELDGKVVAELRDPRDEEMFWYSYAVHAHDSEGLAMLAADDLWQRCRFCFRSLSLGECAPAFTGGRPPFVRDGRVLMRGLYLLPRGFFESAACELLKLIYARPTPPERTPTNVTD